MDELIEKSDDLSASSKMFYKVRPPPLSGVRRSHCLPRGVGGEGSGEAPHVVYAACPAAPLRLPLCALLCLPVSLGYPLASSPQQSTLSVACCACASPVLCALLSLCACIELIYVRDSHTDGKEAEPVLPAHVILWRRVAALASDSGRGRRDSRCVVLGTLDFWRRQCAEWRVRWRGQHMDWTDGRAARVLARPEFTCVDGSPCPWGVCE